MFRNIYTKRCVYEKGNTAVYGRIYNLEKPLSIETVSLAKNILRVFGVPERLLPRDLDNVGNKYTIRVRDNHKFGDQEKLNETQFIFKQRLEYFLIMLLSEIFMPFFSTKLEVYWCILTKVLIDDEIEAGQSYPTCKNEHISSFSYLIMYIAFLSFYNIWKDVLECRYAFKSEVERMYCGSDSRKRKDESRLELSPTSPNPLKTLEQDLRSFYE